jgi:hypothetical protein
MVSLVITFCPVWPGIYMAMLACLIAYLSYIHLEDLNSSRSQGIKAKCFQLLPEGGNSSSVRYLIQQLHLPVSA